MIDIKPSSPAGHFTFELTPQAREILTALEDKLVAVVAVAGPSRSGKSFLLNALLNRTEGFALGHSTNPGTRGIWMWGQPFVKGDTAALFLDTEGLFSLARDKHVDACVLGLAVLLSSVLVYNSLNVVDEKQLAEIATVLELVRWVDADSSPPYLVWCIRDFALDIAAYRDPNDYLDSVLLPRAGDVDEQGVMRRTVVEFFPERACLLFPTPADGKRMQRLERLRYADLREQFRKTVDEFRATVDARLLPKRFAGAGLNGPGFVCFIEEMLGQINSKAVPQVKSAIHRLRESTRQDAVATFREKVTRLATDGEDFGESSLVEPLRQVFLAVREQCVRRQQRELTLTIFEDLLAHFLQLREEGSVTCTVAHEAENAVDEAVSGGLGQLHARLRLVFAERNLLAKQLPLALVERLLTKTVREVTLQQQSAMRALEEEAAELEKTLQSEQKKRAARSDELGPQHETLAELRRRLHSAEQALSEKAAQATELGHQSGRTALRARFSMLQERKDALVYEVEHLRSATALPRPSRLLGDCERLLDDLSTERAEEFRAYIASIRERLSAENTTLQTVLTQLSSENKRLRALAEEKQARESEIESIKGVLRGAEGVTSNELDVRTARLIAENKALQGEKMNFYYLAKETVLAFRQKKNQLKHAVSFFGEDEATELTRVFLGTKIRF